MSTTDKDNIVLMPGVKRDDVMGESDPAMSNEQRVAKAIEHIKEMGFSDIVVIGEDATKRCAIITTDIDIYSVLGRVSMGAAHARQDVHD